MAVVEYGQLLSWNDSLISERYKGKSRPYKVAKNSPPKSFLEEEISRLRRTMENTVLHGNPLTSELVIEISRLLDEKINEYMKILK